MNLNGFLDFFFGAIFLLVKYLNVVGLVFVLEFFVYLLFDGWAMILRLMPRQLNLSELCTLTFFQIFVVKTSQFKIIWYIFKAWHLLDFWSSLKHLYRYFQKHLRSYRAGLYLDGSTELLGEQFGIEETDANVVVFDAVDLALENEFP